MRKSFRGGVHPAGHKELSKDIPFEIYLPHGEMIYPLGQHIGRPASPVVKKGDHVNAGQLIAEASAFVSANIVSGCSGIVKAVERRRTIAGTMTDCIVIDNDGLYENAPGVGEKADYRTLTKEQIIEKVKAAGIIGMGGAGFPTHVKLMPKNPDGIHHVIVNGAECEPYITCDDQLMRAHASDIITGLDIILSLFPNAVGTIVIEDNKKEAIAAMKNACSGRADISVMSVPVKYPQGGERSCISVVTGAHYGITQLPADVGCIVDNVGTVFAVYKAVCESTPLMERGITITGEAVASPKNYMTRIGVSCRELLEHAGGLKNEGAAVKVLAGGPMMGISFDSLDVPMQKNNNAFTFLAADDVQLSEQKQTACIRCGRCVKVCPQGLTPQLMAAAFEKKDYERYDKKLHGLECISCGSCTFVCPAKRPLTQQFKVAKAEIMAIKRAEQAKEGAK
ncbi:MAG: electron transport complex subunit RsxC [Blautia sp.]|nr:electron transport complex subunit RsxC [Blautia sp.]